MNTRLLYLSIIGFNVTYHQKLGASREEFLIANGPIMAQCSNFLVIVSQSGAGSPFVYNEVVFVEWMERNLCTILVREEVSARKSLHKQSGARRNFSRGGGAVLKNFGNFADLFLRLTNLIFRALRKYYKDPIVSTIFCAAGKLSKNRLYCGAFRNGAFRKILCWSDKNGCRKVIGKGEPFGFGKKLATRARGCGRQPPPPPPPRHATA